MGEAKRATTKKEGKFDKTHPSSKWYCSISREWGIFLSYGVISDGNAVDGWGGGENESYIGLSDARSAGISAEEELSLKSD